MLEKRVPIKVEDAIAKVMKFANLQLKWKEMVSIENAYNRFLAEDLTATHDVPSFDRSPYDGFAIRAEDTNKADHHHPIRFEVIGEIGAGNVFNQSVDSFQAVRIMTGAQIPKGCNAIIMLELVREVKTGTKKYIEIKRVLNKGDNISYKGEDIKKEEILVRKGTCINPGIIALLATFGYSEVPVSKKPVIGVLATGSELLNINEPLQEGKVRNSNTYMLLAQIKRAGGEARYFGEISDNFEMCFLEVQKALRHVDVLITTGGVSVGDYDYLPEIYEKLEAEVLFNKIAMRPGSITTVSQLQGKLLVGLSGNPSACYVGFEILVRPVIQSILFKEKPHLKKVKALLNNNYLKSNPFTRFIRGNITHDKSTLLVSPSGFDKSNSISSLIDANGIIILPGGTRGYKKGMEVDVLLLEDNHGSEWPWSDIVPHYK
ncbi:MAG: gephyrin-like molybdotransferase Glp [Bacillus sp. (in: firmicutes)]